MKKNQKNLDRISSKLSLSQITIICIIFGIISVIILCNDAKDMQLNPVSITLFAIFAGVFFFSAVTALEKSADLLIERKTEKFLKIIQDILTYRYTSVKYNPKNSSDMLKLYMQVNERKNFKLYARLDEDNNICIAIKDERGNIAEIKNKRYREFLEDFDV